MPENVLPRFVRQASCQKGFRLSLNAGRNGFMCMEREFAVRDACSLADDVVRLKLGCLEPGLRETFREPVFQFDQSHGFREGGYSSGQKNGGIHTASRRENRGAVVKTADASCPGRNGIRPEQNGYFWLVFAGARVWSGPRALPVP